MRPKPQKDKLGIEVALRNREFEIQLFWQRSNYFLVLITALGAGVIASRDHWIGLLISMFGIGACWLWFKTNLGSRYWQAFWEAEVERLAPTHDLKSFQLTPDEIRESVRQSTASVKDKPYRAWVDGEVLKKPSVTVNMITLSLIALSFWLAIFIYYLILTFGPLFAPRDVAEQTPPVSEKLEPNEATSAQPSAEMRGEGKDASATTPAPQTAPTDTSPPKTLEKPKQPSGLADPPPPAKLVEPQPQTTDSNPKPAAN